MIEDSVLNEVEQNLSGMGRLEKLVLRLDNEDDVSCYTASVQGM